MMDIFQVRLICSLGLVLSTHMIYAISVASTPASYTASSPSNDYASPTTAEPATSDYNNKFNNPYYPSSKQVYDPTYNIPNNHLTESFTPYSSLLSPRAPFLLHRLPSLFNAPVHPHLGQLNPETNAYPSFPLLPSPSPPPPPPPPPPSSYPTQTGFVPSQPIYEPQYPFAYPSKYPKNAYAIPTCDYSPFLSPYRASKPYLYYPQQKPENFYDYLQPAVPGKLNDAQYRYQPVSSTSNGNNFSNNIPVYH